MTLNAHIQCCSGSEHLPDADSVSAWAGAAFAAVAGGDAEVTIRIVDEEEGAALNRRYRDGAGATNVLSFSYGKGEFAPANLLGDIVICAPVVEREAVSASKSVTAHWAHMVVHGILHLCGYDHTQDIEALKMEQVEAEILVGLGFPAAAQGNG